MWRFFLAATLGGIAMTALGVWATGGEVGAVIAAKTHEFMSGSRSFPNELSRQPVEWVQWGVIALLSFGLVWSTIDVSRLSLKLLIAATTLILTLTLAPTLALYGVLFEPIIPVLCGVGALLFGLVFGATERGKRKDLLLEMLGRRVAPETIQRLTAASEPLELGGEDREVALLTCRIFNHQEMRDTLESADVVDLTNLFLRATAEYLLSHGGYLDESAPDCVRVFFGIPEEREKVGEHACRVGLELNQRLENFAVECESRWMLRPECGVAISSGMVTAGLFGSGAYTHYTGVGGQIDFCRRLCGVNRKFGTTVVVDADSYSGGASEFEFRPIDRFFDHGRGLLCEVYELLSEKGNLGEAGLARRDAFWKGVIHLREGETEKARAAFADAGGEGVDDPALATYLKDLDAVGAKNDHAEIGSASQPISGDDDDAEEELAKAFSSLK